MTALFDLSLGMLNRCGLSPNRARKVLLPLVKSSLENLASQTPADALTGTFKRRDIATVRKHIAAIEAQRLHDALMAYAVLGEHSLALTGSRANRRTREIDKILSDILKRFQHKP
jgi:predicted short-subunit dehydrogenase-like oxidoreductase (DUF2520 family)